MLKAFKMLAICSTLVTACSSRQIDDGTIGSSTAAFTVTLGTRSTAQTNAKYASPVWSGGLRQRLVVAYDDLTTPFFGWAQSLDGISWTTCNADTVGCGGAGVVVPRIPNHLSWAGDPTVVSDTAGHVVYVSLANTNTGGMQPARVVASLSTDQGQHFTSSVEVNNTISGIDNCDSGKQDQPHVAMDYSTSPPTIWVVFRHDANMLGTYGGCIRRGRVCLPPDAACPTSAQVVWLDNGHSISNMFKEDDAYGQGAINVLAGYGAPTVISEIPITFSTVLTRE